MDQELVVDGVPYVPRTTAERWANDAIHVTVAEIVRYMRLQGHSGHTADTIERVFG